MVDVMGPVASAVIYGCLLALRWMLWLAAGLLVILTIVQYFRGDEHARPLMNIIMAIAFGVAGLVSAFAGKKIAGN